MKNTVLVKLTLVLSGLMAAGIGLTILAAPQVLHESVGIARVDDVNLLNEVKASGGLLLASGLFALAGAIRARLALPAMIVSAMVYLSYGLSRLVSVVVDGLPNDAILQTIGLELAVATLCVFVLGTQRASQPTVARTPRPNTCVRARPQAG